MRIRLLALAAAMLCAPFALPAKAAPIDLGLCLAVDKALDPNRDGDFSDGSNTAALAAATACASQNKGQGLLSRAYVLRRLRQPVEAQAAIEAGLAAGGDPVVGHRIQCALYGDAGKYDLGREACGKAIAAGPARPLGYLGLGNMEFAAGEWAAAITAYDGALQHGGGEDYSIWVAKGQALNKLGRRQQALASFESARAVGPRDMEGRAELVWTLIAMGDNVQAIAAADNALLIDPTAWNVHRWRGRGLENLGRYQEAFTAYDAAARLNAKSALSIFDRGSMQEQLDRPQEALADYGRAIALDPKLADAYTFRANLLAKLNQPQAAKADYDKAIELAPTIAAYWNNRAVLLLKYGDDAGAEHDANWALNIDPNYAEAYGNRAAVAYHRGRYADVIKDRTAELRLNPSSQPALFWRARAYSEVDNNNAAIADYTALLQLSPGYMWAYHNRGQLLLDKDDCDGAMRDFDVVIRKMPGAGKPWVGSAICAARQDDNGLGFWKENADRWVAAPSTTDKYLAMAYNAAAIGRFDAATQMATQAQAIDPNDPTVKLIIAALGKRDQAEVDNLFSALDDLSGN